MTVTLFLAQAAAPVAVGAPADAAHERVEVPSGAEVWLQEEITDRVPGMGLVARFRFVMPALEDVVPAVDPADLADHLPADMVEGMQDTRPLSPAEQAELDAALGDLVIEAVPDQGHGAGAVALVGDRLDHQIPQCRVKLGLLGRAQRARVLHPLDHVGRQMVGEVGRIDRRHHVLERRHDEAEPRHEAHARHPVGDLFLQPDLGARRHLDALMRGVGGGADRHGGGRLGKKQRHGHRDQGAQGSLG